MRQVPLIALLLCGGALAGCGGAQGPGRVSEEELHTRLAQVIEDERLGYSVRVPEDWKRVTD